MVPGLEGGNNTRIQSPYMILPLVIFATLGMEIMHAVDLFEILKRLCVRDIMCTEFSGILLVTCAFAPHHTRELYHINVVITLNLMSPRGMLIIVILIKWDIRARHTAINLMKASNGTGLLRLGMRWLLLFPYGKINRGVVQRRQGGSHTRTPRLYMVPPLVNFAMVGSTKIGGKQTYAVDLFVTVKPLCVMDITCTTLSGIEVATCVFAQHHTRDQQ